MHFRYRARPESPWWRAGKGALAGVVGTVVMTQAQTKLLPRIPEGKAPKQPRYPMEPEAKGENATETVARRLVEGVAHRPLPRRARAAAGMAVHLGTGAFWGGLLGLLMPRRLSPAATAGWGAAWGAGVWGLNDNLVLPLFKVGDWPNRYGIGVHARAVLAHAVYGVATAFALRELLSPRFVLGPGLGTARALAPLARALRPAGRAAASRPGRRVAARSAPAIARRAPPLVARAAVGRRFGPVKMGAWGIRAG
ncbi:MAG TPA: hypothetical protein VN033_04485 [Vulgatibacter sp.]|nr:hypothetical protein [Vulgatibacter sp.]